MTIPTPDPFQSIRSHNPDRSTLIDTLSTFALARSPPFIHIHDPFTPSQTQVLLTELLQTLSETSRTTNRERRLAHAIVDCTLCFTPKLLFTSILNGLAEFEPTWADGYRSWVFEDDNGERRNENPGDGADVFLENLREFLGGETTGRGAVVVFVNPENMKYGNSNMMSTMSRLRELSRCDISSFFLSRLQWEAIYPTHGTLSQSFTITVDPLSREDLIEFLSRSYHTRPQNEAPTPTYSPSLAPLYTHYITALIDICTPFTSDPTEIAYVAAARWPGFVAPVIAEWEAKVQEREQELSEDGGGEDGMRSGPRLEPPTEEERVRLIRLFSASVTQALERLYPRLESATSWRNRHHPPPTFRLSQIFNVTSIPPSSGIPPTTGDKTVTESEKETDEDWQTRDLPHIARFVLVASFLASHNPAKTDLRMLGHTQDTSGRGRGRGRGRKRKVGAGVGRPTKAGGVKILQRLLGPTSFSLDRLLAITGVLLTEHDEGLRSNKLNLFGGDQPGLSSAVEVTRFLTLSSIQELVSMRLLIRTTPPDRPDSSAMYKCAVSYERALAVARGVGISLGDLMWETS